MPIPTISIILGYFGKRKNLVQKRYREFTESLVGKSYQSPLNDVIGSTVLGGNEFFAFIKERFLFRIPTDKNIPAIKELSSRIQMADVMAIIKSSRFDDERISGNIAIYLCQKHTGKRLKEIGDYFGTGA